MNTLKIAILLTLFAISICSCDNIITPDERDPPLKITDKSLLKNLQNTVDSANHYIYLDLDKADSLIREVFRTPELEQILPLGYYKPYMVKAWVHHGKKQYINAKKSYLQAAKIISKSDDRAGYIECWINLGALLEQTKDTSALTYVENFLTKLDTAQSEDDKIGWILGHQYKARIYGHQKKYDLAFHTLIDALEIPFLQQFSNYSLGIYKSIGIFKNEIGDPLSATKYLKKALTIPRLYPYEQKMLLGELASLYLKQDSLINAKSILQKYELKGKLSDVECHQYHVLYAKLELKQEHYKSALTHTQQAKNCAAPMEDPSTVLANLLLETQIYLGLQQHSGMKNRISQIKHLLKTRPHLKTIEIQAAFSQMQMKYQLLTTASHLLPLLDQHHKATQRQYVYQSQKQLKELTIKYEADKKEQENQQLKQSNIITQLELDKSKLMASLFGTGLMASLIGFFLFYRNRQLKQKNIFLQLKQDKQSLLDQNEVLQEEKEDLATALEATPLKDTLLIHGETKNFVIPFGHIMYIKAEDDGSRFYLNEGIPIWSATPLKKVQSELPELYFKQIFRSVIVNEAFIKSVNANHLTLKCNTKLKVSRTYKGNLDKFRRR